MENENVVQRSLLQLATEVKLAIDCYLYDVEVDNFQQILDETAKLHTLTGIPKDVTEEQVTERVYKIVNDKFMKDENVNFDDFVKKQLVDHGHCEEDKVESLYEQRKGYVVANYIKHVVHESNQCKEDHPAPFKPEDNNYCMMFTNLELFIKDPAKRSYYIDKDGKVQLKDDLKQALDACKTRFSQQLKDEVEKKKNCEQKPSEECHCEHCECEKKEDETK